MHVSYGGIFTVDGDGGNASNANECKPTGATTHTATIKQWGATTGARGDDGDELLDNIGAGAERRKRLGKQR